VIEICDLPDEALRGVADGSTALIGGFGDAGMPFALTDALLRCGVRDLTIVSNNAGNGDTGLAALLAAGQARKVICSFPRQTDSYVFDELDRVGKVELELVPRGTLAERIRAGGAGIGGFYTGAGVGTLLAEGNEVRQIDGVSYLLERPIHGDVALVRAHVADCMGNLVYRNDGAQLRPGHGYRSRALDRRGERERGRGHRGPRPRERRYAGDLRGPGGHRLMLTRDQIARRGGCRHPGRLRVNRGIGQPTRVADYLRPEQQVVLHTENGMLNMGPEATGGSVDLDLVNAGKIPVTALPGASYFHHEDSFALIRGGHLDSLRPGRFSGLRIRRPGQLARRRAGRHTCRRRCDGPGRRRQGRLRDDEPPRERRLVQVRRRVQLPDPSACTPTMP
jgi:3-oxoacid CoA-transferase A subunit